MSQIIKLNVGGVRYETTRATLSRDPNGMIARMIEQPAEIRKINNGEELFIDRDGNDFKYVLNYLRDGEYAILPTGSSELQGLRKEADFYQLQGLVRLVDILKRGGNFKVGDLINDQRRPKQHRLFRHDCQGRLYEPALLDLRRSFYQFEKQLYGIKYEVYDEMNFFPAICSKGSLNFKLDQVRKLF